MSRLIVGTMLVLLAATVSAQETDTVEMRTAAAERYLKVSGTPSDTKLTTQALIEAVPSEMKETVRLVFADPEFNKKLELKMKEGLLKHFSTRELDAMTAYYSSPLGKSATAKMDAYMAEFIPVMTLEVITALKAAKAKSDAARKDAKTP